MDLSHEEIVLLIDALRIRSRILEKNKSFVTVMFKDLKSISKTEINESIRKNDILLGNLTNLVFENKDEILLLKTT